ncbi:MAG: DUF433 domain-containing protein [Deltaproteobacteria bacterium]|nr:DUF433 domain-containing protein [Deltaproteobacteria bacterium]
MRPARRAGHWRFSEADALFFALRNAIPFDIDRADQKALYEMLVAADADVGSWACWRRVNEDTIELLRVRHHRTKSCAEQPGLRVVVDFKEIREALMHRLDVLEKRTERITSTMDILGGTPVFAGTRVSVRHVGLLMLRGVPMKVMKEDFPYLKDDDFELARLLALIGPPPGRPRRLPPLRFSRDGQQVHRDVEDPR